jgi:hypothetical protein
LRLETYQGVATEVPDTRPPLASRFAGMQVYTTDTDRVFLWDGANWRCIRQPLMPCTLSHDAGFNLGAGGNERAGYSRSGHQVMLQWEGGLGTGATVSPAFFTIPVPAKWSAVRQIGIAMFYDVSTGLIHHGSCDLYVTDSLIRLYIPAPYLFGPTNTNPFTWAANDQIWFKLVYDAADNV